MHSCPSPPVIGEIGQEMQSIPDTVIRLADSTSKSRKYPVCDAFFTYWCLFVASCALMFLFRQCNFRQCAMSFDARPEYVEDEVRRPF